MDYKFYAKVGNKYLKNKKLVSKGRDEFECREEPTQIINQMKKDGKIDKKAKVKIQKIKESYKEMSWPAFLKDYEEDAYPLAKHDGIEKHRDDSKVRIFTNDGAVAFVFVDKSVVKVFHLERNVLLKGVKGSGSALLKDIISTYKDRPIELTAQNTKPESFEKLCNFYESLGFVKNGPLNKWGDQPYILKPKNHELEEACMENTYGYHLSPFSFSEPKINYKAGFGTSFYGCGFYITLDEDVVDTMKSEAQDMFTEYFIYTIKVDENANIVDEGDEDGLALYADLVEQFNGDEVKASAEMVKRGVDGILYYSEEDGHSIVFYNPKMAKIVKTEYHQGWGERSELNENAYDDAYKRKVNNMVSKKDKWNLKMDIESLKKELVDLQNTASQLPDEYVREVCDFDSYPFDDEIDDDQNLNSWCTEVDNFLDDSLNM